MQNQLNYIEQCSLQEISDRIHIRNILKPGFQEVSNSYFDYLDYLDSISENQSYDEPIQKKLFHIFCGIGKSRLMLKIAIDFIIKSEQMEIQMENDMISDEGNDDQSKLIVFVFPSLALINTYQQDYLFNKEQFGDLIEHFKFLSVCSLNDKKNEDFNLNVTTSVKDIKQFLKNTNNNKIITITYQSYELLQNSLKDKRIDLCLFDEAHHSTENKNKDLIYTYPKYKRGYFFTATPRNANGIIQYDHENDMGVDCGDRVIHISYQDGLNAGILKPYEIMVNIVKKQPERNQNSYEVYKQIARAILKSGNSRVLTFHRYTQCAHNNEQSNVLDFVNEKAFKKAFNEVQEQEFPDLKSKYKKITFKGIAERTSKKQLPQILNEFDQTPDDQIFILSSCRTIGEGVDTKKANMVVFADSKNSLTEITQNIGRIVRRTGECEKPSTILIPCFVDFDKYKDAKTNEERNIILRNELNQNGDFSSILNVLSALQQDDEEYFMLCLKYPNTFSEKEIEISLNNQGFKVDWTSSPKSYESEFGELGPEKMASDNDYMIEIHSNNMKEPIQYFGTNEENIKRYYLTEENKVYPIIELENKDKENKGNKVKSNYKINPPLKRKSFQLKVDASNDFKVLWKIKDDDLNDLQNQITTVSLECMVENLISDKERRIQQWCENRNNVKKIIDENNKRPNSKSKNKEEKQLGQWLSSQNSNYNPDITKCKKIMKTKEIKEKWEEFINDPKYKEYFQSNEEQWFLYLEKVKKFIDENNKRPNSNQKKNKEEQQLGKWLSHQNKNYDPDITKCKYIMKNIEIKEKWEEFINDPKYKDYFLSNEEKWTQNFNNLKKFIDENNKRPNSNQKKNKEEQQLGQWLVNQNQNYDPDITKCKKIMKTKETKEKWEEFINDPKYKEYFKSNEESWFLYLDKVKKFIDENNKRPSQTSKNKKEKQLGQWLVNQNKNYDPDIAKCKYIMKNIEIKEKWEEFINDPKYKEYFKSNKEIWSSTFDNLMKFIDENNKRPNSNQKKNNEEKKLGEWLSDQNKNYDTDITKCKKIMKTKEIKEKWEEFINDPKYKEYFKSNKEIWSSTFDNLMKFIDENNKRPSQASKNKKEKQLGQWLSHQNKNYDPDIAKCKQIMKTKQIKEKWEEFINDPKYKAYFQSKRPKQSSPSLQQNIIDKVKPTKSKIKDIPKQLIPQNYISKGTKRKLPEISKLHQKYKRMSSKELHKEFNENDGKRWKEYHEIVQQAEQNYENEDMIPYRQVINYIEENIKGKRNKTIADFGCGTARIYNYFKQKGITRFQFRNFDHYSCDDYVEQKDISDTGLEDNEFDIVILSLAMWGSNSQDYIKEAYRVLDNGGRLIMVEANNERWAKDGQSGIKLVRLIESYGFNIDIKNLENKFIFIVAFKH